MILRIPHATDRTYARGGNATGGKNIARTEVGELREDIVIFGGSTVTVPAQAEIQSQAGRDFPVVLYKNVIVVISVVTVGTRLGAGSGVDGRFLEVGIVASKVGLRFVLEIGDGSVGLQLASIRIRGWGYRRAG